MTEIDLKTSVLTSLFWKTIEGGGVSGIQLIVQIIIARLLLPQDYGIIGLITIFIAISQTFIDSGLSTALIQKKDVTDEDYSSVFYLSMVIASILYCILFVTSPLIANFYGQPLIVPILRVLGITLFFGALNSIQNAIISRNFQFKKLCISSLGAITLSGIVGISLAYYGYGIWALVGQQIVSIVTLCVIMWVTVKWRPKLYFSLKKIKGLFSFGWKLLTSSIISVTYNNLSSLVIGKLYPTGVLGFYRKGQEFPYYLVSNINTSIQSVMFPAYSKNQDNKIAVKQLMRRALTTSSFLIFPAMAGLAAVADPLIRLLLTDKWVPAVPYLQLFCIVFALWPVHTVNLHAINALGRSDIFLKLEIIKKLIGICILAITIPMGIYAMTIGMAITQFIGTFVNAYPNKLLLKYSFREQWKDLMPALALSLIMFGGAYGILYLKLPNLIALILQMAVGSGIYLGLAWLLKMEPMTYLLDTGIEYIHKLKKAC